MLHIMLLVPLNYPSRGDLQNNMGLVPPQFTPPGWNPTNNYHLVTKNMNFSRPMFYYFGLRPGKTAFSIFVTKYIDEDFNEAVL